MSRRAGQWTWRSVWNWKSAVLSAGCRAAIFFLINLGAGWAAAFDAMTLEFLYRAVTSGWFGAMTERFGRRRPRAWMPTEVLFATVVAHAVEFALHARAGTPRLALSMAGSFALSLLTTAFNVFAMRRGAFIVGPGRRSFGTDLMALPSLIGAFARSLVVAPFVSRMP